MKIPLLEILISAIIGIAFAGLIGILNDNHIIIDSYLTADITITELQFFVFLLFFIIGIIIGTARSG